MTFDKVSENLKKLGIWENVMFSMSGEPFGEGSVVGYGILGFICAGFDGG